MKLDFRSCVRLTGGLLDCWLTEGVFGWVWFIKLLNAFDGKRLVDGSNEANGSNDDWVEIGQRDGWTLDK